jgi:hypothetical protein
MLPIMKSVAAIVAILAYATSLAATDEAAPFPYAFAHRLGSGIYAVQGRTVQIYRIPFSYAVRPLEGRRWGATITASATLGFFDFKARDVFQKELPENLGTLSIVPGAEFPVRVYERWNLTPQVEAGWAREFETGDSVWVYDFGLRSLALFPAGPGAFRLGNELFRVGQSSEGATDNGPYTEFDTGLEYRWPLGFRMAGHEADFGVFGLQRLYWIDTGEPVKTRSVSVARYVGARDSYEIGVTLGTATRAKVWIIPIPRFGLSYRVSEGVGAVRIVFGSPF